MNRQRLAAAIFFSVVILAVLGVIVGAEVVSGGATVTVLRLRVGVPQGAVFSTSDVQAVPMRLTPGDLNYVAAGSVSPGSRYASALHAGDLLRPDDLVSGGARIAVTLTLTDPPPLSPGSAIDLYAIVPASQPGSVSEVLIGHDLSVLQVQGGTVTLLVSSGRELAWLAVEMANGGATGSTPLKLYAFATTGTLPSGMPPDDVSQALCQLAPTTCPNLSPTTAAPTEPLTGPPAAAPSVSP